MELSTIDLYGKPFVQCFTLSNAKRISREMKGEACLTFIRKGNQEFHSPVNKFKIGDRESILMKCGNFVIGQNNAEPKEETLGMVFHLNPLVVDQVFGGKKINFLGSSSKPILIDSAIKIGHTELLEAFTISMLPYFENKELVTEELIALKLRELVTILLCQGDDQINYLLSTILEKEVYEFDSIIDSNLFNNLSIVELAHLTGKSESSFKREFKRLYNESPAKYIKAKKLEKGVELLSNSEMSVSEISWACGFEDLAHFSSSFSNVYAKSPRKFRDSL